MFSEEIREDIERYIILYYRPEGAKEPIYALELGECQFKNGTIVREIIKELFLKTTQYNAEKLKFAEKKRDVATRHARESY